MGGWGCATGRSGRDCTVGPRSGPGCTVGPLPSGPYRAPIAPSGPDRAPIAPSRPDQGEIALSLVALLYKAASSATPAVRMVTAEGFHQGSTRVPPGFHQGSTRVPPGFHMLLGISPELIKYDIYHFGGRLILRRAIQVKLLVVTNLVLGHMMFLHVLGPDHRLGQGPWGAGLKM